MQGINLKGIHFKDVADVITKPDSKVWALNMGEVGLVTFQWSTLLEEAVANSKVCHMFVEGNDVSRLHQNHFKALCTKNLKKHDLHCSESNAHVINQITHMARKEKE